MYKDRVMNYDRLLRMVTLPYPPPPALVLVRATKKTKKRTRKTTLSRR